MKEKATKMLEKAKRAKLAHIKSKQCERHTGHPCGGCHFWSGTIAALSELLDLPPSIGEADIIVAEEKARATIERLRKDMEIDPAELDKPMTI